MLKLSESINLQCYTLILPSIAIGNVAQLSVDLIISNLNLKKIGQILTPAFIPIIGSNSYDEESDDLCTAIDLYAGVLQKIVVIQIRSPFVNRLQEFYHDLLNFITEQKISKVIILTSSYAYEKGKNQLKTTDLRYIPSADIFSENKKLFEDLHWCQYESKNIFVDERKSIKISGGGFANSLFDFLCNNNIPCIILFRFCSEGDNIPDAQDLLYYLNQWLKLLESDINGSIKIKYPPSWTHLFGNALPLDIY